MKKNYKIRPYSIAWYTERIGEAAGLFLTIAGSCFFIVFLGI